MDPLYAFKEADISAFNANATVQATNKV